MSSNRMPYPPRTPSFEVGIGRHGNQWYVGIKPTVSTELLAAAGGRALSGWAAGALDESTKATVLSKLDTGTHAQASQVAVVITLGMARETGKSGIYSPVIIDMASNSAPFISLQPRT